MKNTPLKVMVKRVPQFVWIPLGCHIQTLVTQAHSTVALNLLKRVLSPYYVYTAHMRIALHEEQLQALIYLQTPSYRVAEKYWQRPMKIENKLQLQMLLIDAPLTTVWAVFQSKYSVFNKDPFYLLFNFLDMIILLCCFPC